MTTPLTEHDDRSGAAPAVIDIAGVSVALEGRPVLRAIDLTVAPGEIVAVLGGNGSGKSTLVRTLLGLVPVLRGDVHLFGTPLAEFRDWRRIGYVPQRLGAGTGVPATVREVVSAGRLSHRRLLRPTTATDRAAVTDAIEAVGLTDRSHDAAGSLSGGQQQRVLIARALATQPDVLVLDEPTAGVDLPSQGTFADVLRAMVDRGVTIVLVAHELGPLEPLVTRAVVMHDGRVGYDGPPSGTAWLTHTHGGHHHDLSDGGTGSFPVVASPVDRHRDAPQGGTS